MSQSKQSKTSLSERRCPHGLLLTLVCICGTALSIYLIEQRLNHQLVSDTIKQHEKPMNRADDADTFLLRAEILPAPPADAPDFEARTTKIIEYYVICLTRLEDHAKNLRMQLKLNLMEIDIECNCDFSSSLPTDDCSLLALELEKASQKSWRSNPTRIQDLVQKAIRTNRELIKTTGDVTKLRHELSKLEEGKKDPKRGRS